MPIWDFSCPKCGKVEERLVRSSDPSPICSECEVTMTKKISSTYKIAYNEPWRRLGERLK